MHAPVKLEELKKARERTVAIETYTHLRGDVREQERLIHGILRGRHKVRTRMIREKGPSTSPATVSHPQPAPYTSQKKRKEKKKGFSEKQRQL